MKLTTRYRKRAFRLETHLPPNQFNEYAWDVISSIERETIEVVDPNDPNARDYLTDSDGAFLIDGNETLTVPIKDWLAVGCQRIRWESTFDTFKENTLCFYQSNAGHVFGTPDGETIPLGPSVFVGEIVFPLKIQQAYFDCKGVKETTDIIHTFQFILAHELVHVFDILKYLVPAFTNWRAFWKNILNEGCSTDLMYSRMSDKSLFIDNYGQEHELERIRYYWPSRADNWFQTRNLDWNKLFKKRK